MLVKRKPYDNVLLIKQTLIKEIVNYTNAKHINIAPHLFVAQIYITLLFIFANS